MPDILSGLIWVQSVYKGFQQMTLGGKELSEKIFQSLLNRSVKNNKINVRICLLILFVCQLQVRPVSDIFEQV